MYKEVKEFLFTEAEPLLAFIDQKKDRIVGQTVKALYMNGCYGSISDEPLVFELDDFVIVIHCFFYSNLTIQIVDLEQFHADKKLTFLYKDKPASQNVGHYVFNTAFFGVGRKVVDVTIERFSGEFNQFEIGWIRPPCGDYFKTITVHLDNGKRFYFCALDAIHDGYVEIWDDDNVPYGREPQGG